MSIRNITFIIVAYNSVNIIADCIESIFKNTDDQVSTTVMVVDNSERGIATETEELVKRRFGSRVLYFATGENVGYGAGNNIGIERSLSEIICVINPDVRLTERVSLLLLNKFESDRSLALLGFRQRGGLNISSYFYPNFYIPLIASLLLRALNRFCIFIPTMQFPSGAFVAIRREYFMEVGGYDENFFLYYEDADLSKRFVGAGYRVDIDYSVSYIHLIDLNARRRRSEFSKAIELASLKYFLRKHRHLYCWHAIIQRVKGLGKNLMKGTNE